jgi:hypothetical protein
MNAKHHLTYFLQGTLAWAGFWLLGLPDYYQQYSQKGLAVGSILLSVGISLLAVYALRRVSDTHRMPRAIWLAFYLTVPLAIYDTLYCGAYLGYGSSYLGKYWYLTIFYLTPWLTFPPTARLLNGRLKPPAER